MFPPLTDPIVTAVGYLCNLGPAKKLALPYQDGQSIGKPVKQASDAPRAFSAVSTFFQYSRKKPGKSKEKPFFSQKKPRYYLNIHKPMEDEIMANTEHPRPIGYLAADHGGIESFDDLGMPVGHAKTPQALAAIWIKHGLARVVGGSSNMDFGTEEGFATDDGPMKLHDAALSIYNWEVHRVAS